MKASGLVLTTVYDREKPRHVLSFDVDPDEIQFARGLVDELNGHDIEVQLKKYRRKRSLDANAYFWALCNKLSAKVNVPPKKIYREYLRDVGGNFTVLCVPEKAVDDFIATWEGQGDGWVCEPFPSKIESCVNVRAYYGSSTYNTEQMSRLIDLIVEDCKEHNIETMTPEELRRLVYDSSN